MFCCDAVRSERRLVASWVIPSLPSLCRIFFTRAAGTSMRAQFLPVATLTLSPGIVYAKYRQAPSLHFP